MQRLQTSVIQTAGSKLSQETTDKKKDYNNYLIQSQLIVVEWQKKESQPGGT